MRLFFTLILLIGAAACLYLVREPVLIRLGEFLIRSEPAQKADAIVMLGGSVPDRMLEVVDLYKQGFAPRVVLGAEPPNPAMAELERRGVHIPQPSELNVMIAKQLGVPASALTLLPGNPNSTVTEAMIMIPHLRQIRARKVIVVTSKMHTHRASRVYRDAAPDIEFVIVATRHDPFDPKSWWQSRGLIRRLVFEYQKLFIYLARDQWRAFIPPPPSGKPAPGNAGDAPLAVGASL